MLVMYQLPYIIYTIHLILLIHCETIRKIKFSVSNLSKFYKE